MFNKHLAYLFIATFLFIATLFFSPVLLFAGPYNEIGVNGYIGPDFRHADPQEANAIVNPIFRGWATDYQNYLPSDAVDYGYDNPNKAFGYATGDNNSIVSLGDILPWNPSSSGEITLIFGDPLAAGDPNHIRDVNGYDFVVFENSFFSLGGDDIFAELGYVEVSSDGVNFIRFDSVSLTAGSVNGFGFLDASDVFNLAGKHINSYGICTGTGFDLAELAGHDNVISGLIDLDDICYVKIVDIAGSGDLFDTAMNFTDPATYPSWSNYLSDNRIYDAWITIGTGGFDLEAIGVLRDQNHQADLNLDGIVDVEDLQVFCSTWLSHFGQTDYIDKSDMASPKNLIIDFADFSLFANQWQKQESWRTYP